MIRNRILMLFMLVAIALCCRGVVVMAEDAGVDAAVAVESVDDGAAVEGEQDSVQPEGEDAAKGKPVENMGFIGKVLDIFQRGGVVMWVLLFISMVGATFAFERFVGLRRGAHVHPEVVDNVHDKLKKEGVDAARLLLRGEDRALYKVIDGLLARRGANRQELERVLEDEAGRVLWDLRKNIRPVGIVASVAPLVGLLGTVMGMISAFQEAAVKGMDNPANFAEGIYQALYTTAAGLTIAIPFLIAFHYLRGKADVIVREVEDLGIKFIIEMDSIAIKKRLLARRKAAAANLPAAKKQEEEDGDEIELPSMQVKESA